MLVDCTSLKSFIFNFFIDQSDFPGFASMHEIRTKLIRKMNANNTAYNIAAYLHKCNFRVH